jgi:hypothetical protein
VNTGLPAEGYQSSALGVRESNRDLHEKGAVHFEDLDPVDQQEVFNDLSRKVEKTLGEIKALTF